MLDRETEWLLSSYYEDLNGRVLEVRSNDDESVVVTFECDDWNETSGYEQRRRFEIRGDGVVEISLHAPYGWVAELYSTAGRLVEDHHSADWVQVYWKTRPKHPHEVIGVLYDNHEKFADRARDLRDYLVASPRTLRNPNGLLLDGPRSYALSQAESVGHLLNVYTLAASRKSRSVVGIGIDDAVMICSSVSTTELATD